MYVCPCIIYENDETYQLDTTILYIIINNYMFRAYICPSSGIQVVYYSIWWLSRIQTYTQCTRLHTGSSVPQPQHLVLNTICSSIQTICSWRWAYSCPKHVELFMIINKLLHQVGTSRHFHIWCTDTHTSNLYFYFCRYFITKCNNI